MFVVFDLDGTLANIEHRRHHVTTQLGSRKKNFDEFFAACGEDKPIEPVLETLRSLNCEGHTVEIWSGRSDVVRAETEAWLYQQCVYTCDSREQGGRNRTIYLQMRKHGDYTSDVALKESWLMEIPPESWPEMVFDDRDRVVAMWRSHGIVCAQVAPGDF